jgi:hypothetical protein
MTIAPNSPEQPIPPNQRRAWEAGREKFPCRKCEAVLATLAARTEHEKVAHDPGAWVNGRRRLRETVKARRSEIERLVGDLNRLEADLAMPSTKIVRD